jgi:hypothetical protein
MTSIVRSLLPLVALLVGCASGGNAPAGKPVYPPSEVAGTIATCEKICDVQAISTTVETFCDVLVQKTQGILGDSVTCQMRGPLGLPTRDEAAVRDAMVVDLTVTKPEDARYSVLALRTASGWELAAELGAVRGAAVSSDDSFKVVGARPVDSPDVSPYGVEIRVRITEQSGEQVDKVFVCGKTDKNTSCPRAIIAGD